MVTFYTLDAVVDDVAYFLVIPKVEHIVAFTAVFSNMCTAHGPVLNDV